MKRVLLIRPTTLARHPLKISALTRISDFRARSSLATHGIDMNGESSLFEYTSGRWIWNDALRRKERCRRFDIAGLKHLAAAALDRSERDIIGFEKLAEGGFNRVFLLTFKGDVEIIARVPYDSVQPRDLVVASEVATLDFLRSSGIPTPVVYGYSASCQNSAGVEYILMERVRGQALGDVWFEMPDQVKRDIATQVVKLEASLFHVQLPAYGSVYYQHDMQSLRPETSYSPLPNTRFCIGPDTSIGMWYGRRLEIDVARGPCKPLYISRGCHVMSNISDLAADTDAVAVLGAGAQKESAYLKRFGQPLQPIQPVRREVYKYEAQQPWQHGENLDLYQRLVPDVLTRLPEPLLRPTIRHADLNPNNMIISDAAKIVGVIDWQHCVALPLIVQHGVPSFVGRLKDEPSSGSAIQSHYLSQTLEVNVPHARALGFPFATLIRDMYGHASEPWEGDNFELGMDLCKLRDSWSELTSCIVDESCGNTRVDFPGQVAHWYQHLETPLREADEQYQACLDVVGVGPEGWVPTAFYDEARSRAAKLKADALEAAESEEESQKLRDNWIFDDFDESLYK